MRHLLVMALFVGVISSGCARRVDALEVRPHDSVAVVLANGDAAEVEYIRVDGQSCLQPKVIVGDPEDADLVRAQHRWLAKTYPGYRLVRQFHVLTLAPEFRPHGQENDEGPGEHDSLEFESAEGKPIAECFSLMVSRPDGDDK